MATNSSILAWKIPWTEEGAWKATVNGAAGRKESDMTEGLTLKMWNLPGAGIEVGSPVLVGGVLSTVPPGKP